MSKPCSPKSKFVNNPLYACNGATGRYNLLPGNSKPVYEGPQMPKKAPVKRGSRGFDLYSKKVRAGIKAANVNLPSWQIPALISAEWKKLGTAGQKEFNDQAKATKGTSTSASSYYY